MEVKRRIEKVGRYHLGLFVLPAASMLFYGWLQASELNQRPDNPQRVAPIYRRGSILTRDGGVLAETVQDKRMYPEGMAAGSLVGYQLRGRNQTGLEAALRTQLSPPLPAASLSSALAQDREERGKRKNRLLGPDVTVTLDLKLQKKLFEAMDGLAGAVVVADREGNILAAVSSPSYDPAQVGKQWQSLQNDQQKPFIERVGSGLYPVKLPDVPAALEGNPPTHSWFSDEPFPDYPLASSAAWIDERLLLTPLMLLQLSYEWSSTALPPTITLLESQLEDAAPIPTKATPPTPSEGELALWTLEAPPFRKSPEFIAAVGTVGGEKFFSIVLEQNSPEAQAVYRERLLPALQKTAEQGNLQERL